MVLFKLDAALGNKRKYPRLWEQAEGAWYFGNPGHNLLEASVSTQPFPLESQHHSQPRLPAIRELC